MKSFILTIFSGAFLLFLVQPLLARAILPWFGGGPAVWTACMLFFQLCLLAGYALAHGLITHLTARNQAIFITLLATCSLLCLPILPTLTHETIVSGHPALRILWLLLVTIGIPFLLLSMTSPLLQAWHVRVSTEKSPYRLYAISNAGSLLALAAYPLLLEPVLQLEDQSSLWSGIFLLFVAGLLYCTYQSRHTTEPQSGTMEETASNAPADTPEAPPGGLIALWVGLSACGSALLLSTTSTMCQDIAVVPFLWVLPLGLYLLTFILCFEKENIYHRRLFLYLFMFSLWMLMMVVDSPSVAMAWKVIGFSALMFVGCMLCHGELVHLKPHPRYLTRFYLAMSFGGALGGVFISLVAPRVFHGYLEYFLALGGCMVLLRLVALREKYAALERAPRFLWLRRCALGVTCLGLMWVGDAYLRDDALTQVRNFYGVLKVVRYDNNGKPYRYLKHGATIHGVQFEDKTRRRWPVSYYGRHTGAGLALHLHPARLENKPLRVGVIGLGTGTLTAHGKPGDEWWLYEINPQVIRLAKSDFTYLQDTPATLHLVEGDARVSLERQWHKSGSLQFDVLLVDAFSSDSIPVHLLTRECFSLYWKHLNPDGVLALHITNRYLALHAIARGLAEDAKMDALFFESENNRELGHYATNWVLVSPNKAFMTNRLVADNASAWPSAPAPLLWTDQYSSLLHVLKW